jgi:peroxiredoxin
VRRCWGNVTLDSCSRGHSRPTVKNKNNAGERPRGAFAEADALDAPLAQKLEAFTRLSRQALPEVHDAYDRLVARIAPNGARAPAVGDKLPDGVLADVMGRLVDVPSDFNSGPLVVSFNRGAWCSYCGLQLRALARAYPEISGLGADVVAIVPETGQYARALKEVRELPFNVLVDLDLGYALSLGLVFWIGDELKDMYLKLGIDLARFQRNDGWFLPIPATFVLGRDGFILARFLDPEFRRRMPIEEIAAALKAGKPAG